MEDDMPQAAITDRSSQSPPYKRHQAEQTLLYQIIERHYPEFRDEMAMLGKPCHSMCNMNLRITSNADGWNTDSCRRNAANVIMSTW
jgi:hypothetical protein